MTPTRWIAVGGVAGLIAIALYLGVATALAHATEYEPPDLHIVHTDER